MQESSTNKTTIKTDFTFHLPDEFDVQPISVIPVATNWTARIYETAWYDTSQGGHLKGYRVDTRHNVTGIAHDYYETKHVTNKVALKLVLLDIVASLRPKTRSVRTTNSLDD